MLFHSLSRKASLGSIAQNAANGIGHKTRAGNLRRIQLVTNADTTLSSIIPLPKKATAFLRCERRFLSFFEKNGHTRIKPYPVVARWRKDIYLTHASIIDFQPYVTEGISPPPANPLVISQPASGSRTFLTRAQLLAGT